MTDCLGLEPRIAGSQCKPPLRMASILSWKGNFPPDYEATAYLDVQRTRQFPLGQSLGFPPMLLRIRNEEMYCQFYLENVIA
jgi:hypothetical protein